MRVAGALVLHEFLERARDKWVLVVSLLFAALSSAVAAYGASSDAAATLTGPSLVTLASLFVPLVALVLSHDAIVGERERNTLGLLLSLPVSRAEVVIAKLVGRGSALALSVLVGMGIAVAFAEPGAKQVLLSLMGPTLLLGLAFLSIGMLLSTLTSRQAVATSMVVVVWFALVLFYDLGLLGLLVVSDGAVEQSTIVKLVLANPAGLYRVEMMTTFMGADAFADLGLVAELPKRGVRALIWAAWLVVPVALSALALSRKKVAR